MKISKIILGMAIVFSGVIMAQKTTVIMRGNTIQTVGELPKVGKTAPDFSLTNEKMQQQSLNDFKGKYLVLNIFPSVDTGVCAASVRHFNEAAANLPNTNVLCISKDLPFAQKRFCGAEGIKNVVMLSDFRSDFGKIYGVEMLNGDARGLLSRAVLVIDPSGKIIYEEQVPDIGQEPNYAAAIKSIK